MNRSFYKSLDFWLGIALILINVTTLSTFHSLGETILNIFGLLLGIGLVGWILFFQ